MLPVDPVACSCRAPNVPSPFPRKIVILLAPPFTAASVRLAVPIKVSDRHGDGIASDKIIRSMEFRAAGAQQDGDRAVGQCPTTRSGLPSPLKSPRAIAVGAVTGRVNCR